ncbi:MAG TPA: glycoside hydrolase family 38 C-terminal domain-containing protein, partial [Candidatus Lokiarchaeia archaeon]|nr:glycoside hydrolase family 38 C-terminal domain-containing protein [Candidatus Lokiarchaeia archaeon]
YDDLVEDWATCHATLQSILNDVSGHVVAPEGTQFMVFNPLSWSRIARIFIPASILDEEIALDPEGRPPAAVLELLGASSRRVPAQPVAADPEGWKEPRPAGWWAVANLESLSVTPARIILGEEDGIALTADAVAPHLDNGILRVELDPSTGGIATMVSTLVPTIENLVQGSLNNLTEAYEDKSKAWPAWNITPRYWEFPVAMPNDQDVAIVLRDCGPVFATLDVTRTLGADQSPVMQRYTVFKDCPELFCEYVADWQTPMVMLKLGIDTTTGATRCTADITYGAAERSTVPVTPADKARIEKICHKYYDVSTPDDAWGVATLNEGKYAFDANEGRTRVTMLRSPPYPDPASESWTRKERQARLEKDGTKVPTHSGLGPFRCRYAYLPHAGGGLRTPEGKPNPAVKHAAEEFNTPVLVVKLPQDNTDAEGLVVDGAPFVEVSVPNIAVTVIKANEWELNGNLLMRVVETLGQDGEADITLGQSMAKNIAGIREVDLLERVDGCVPAANIPRRGASFHVSLHKFEIKTFELVLT